MFVGAYAEFRNWRVTLAVLVAPASVWPQSCGHDVGHPWLCLGGGRADVCKHGDLASPMPLCCTSIWKALESGRIGPTWLSQVTLGACAGWQCTCAVDLQPGQVMSHAENYGFSLAGGVFRGLGAAIWHPSERRGDDCYTGYAAWSAHKNNNKKNIPYWE